MELGDLLYNSDLLLYSKIIKLINNEIDSDEIHSEKLDSYLDTMETLHQRLSQVVQNQNKYRLFRDTKSPKEGKVDEK
jgi:hypothetical protein